EPFPKTLHIQEPTRNGAISINQTELLLTFTLNLKERALFLFQNQQLQQRKKVQLMAVNLAGLIQDWDFVLCNTKQSVQKEMILEVMAVLMRFQGQEELLGLIFLKLMQLWHVKQLVLT
ncbi:hypothetical protein KD27_05655, partial [Smithella sp. D17]